MTSDAPELELRLTPHGIVAPLEQVAADRGCRGVLARFADHEAAGLVALAN